MKLRLVSLLTAFYPRGETTSLTWFHHPIVAVRSHSSAPPDSQHYNCQNFGAAGGYLTTHGIEEIFEQDHMFDTAGDETPIAREVP